MPSEYPAPLSPSDIAAMIAYRRRQVDHHSDLIAQAPQHAHIYGPELAKHAQSLIQWQGHL